MQWDDIGFLLSKTKYSENSLIIEVFTENHGKCSGIVFGGTSKKIKNYLQVGNNIYINYNYKNVGKTGYFKVEIIDDSGSHTIYVNQKSVPDYQDNYLSLGNFDFNSGLGSVTISNSETSEVVVLDAIGLSKVINTPKINLDNGLIAYYPFKVMLMMKVAMAIMVKQMDPY